MRRNRKVDEKESGDQVIREEFAFDGLVMMSDECFLPLIKNTPRSVENPQSYLEGTGRGAPLQIPPKPSSAELDAPGAVFHGAISFCELHPHIVLMTAVGPLAWVISG